MSNSSQQQNSLNTSADTYTITIDSTSYTDTITLNDMSIGAAGAQPVYNWASGISTVSVDNIVLTDNSFTFTLPKEWVDCFPDWHRVEDMCKKYPGLEIAFRNFQTVYQLVKDDYDNPTPKK